MKLIVKFLIIASFSLFLTSSLISNAYATESFFEGPIKVEMYSKLSQLINGTGNSVNQAIQAIKSGNNEAALDILSNVTNNMKEIANGIDIFTSAPD